MSIVNIQEKFDLTPEKKSLRLKDLHTFNEAKNKFNHAHLRVRGKGFTDDDFMNLSYASACALEAVWEADPFKNYDQFNYSRASLLWPDGEYWFNWSYELSSGIHQGQGTNPWYDSDFHSSTQLCYWHEEWIDPNPERILMKQGAWGIKTFSSYAEGFDIDGFRLCGAKYKNYTEVDGYAPAWYDPNFQIHGLGLWRTGEASRVQRIYCETFNGHGCIIGAGVPCTIEVISSFRNNLSGIGIEDGALGTYNIGTLSGDDNATLISSHGSMGEPGGTINIDCIKHEAGISTGHWQSKGQIVGHFDGQFAVNIGSVSFAASSTKPDAMFVVNPILNNGAQQDSHLKVGSVKGFGHASYVHDLVNKKGWKTLGDWHSVGFEWSHKGKDGNRKGEVTSSVDFEEFVNNSPHRLGYLSNASESFDYEAGTPEFPWTGPGTVEPPVDPEVYSIALDSTLDMISIPGSTASIMATVSGTGAYNPAVTWEIVSGLGVLSTTTDSVAVYQAPNTIESDSSVVIKATSNETNSVTEEITINLRKIIVDPGPGNHINPDTMGIVINNDDPSSEALALQYRNLYSIPADNVVKVNLGSGEDVPASSISVARQKIESDLGVQVQRLALCFKTPSRSYSNSITSAITYGYASFGTNGPLPNSPLYNYTGQTPYTDTGFRPSMLVREAKIAERGKQSHGSHPSGTSYMLAANDQNGQPRGRSRLTQMQNLNGSTNFAPIAFSFRNGLSGPAGENEANNILNKDDMLMYWNGMYKIYGMGSNNVMLGAVGDYVTSTSGALPTGWGQTPITYLADHGFVGMVGTVIEPWQSGSGGSQGGLVEQFTNIERFAPWYRNGWSLIDCFWRSIKWPSRSLILGDPMCAPYAGETPAPIPGCTDPLASNYNEFATVDDGSCVFVQPGDAILAYDFDGDSTPEKLVARVGEDITQTTGWRHGKLVGGKLIVDHYNAHYALSNPIMVDKIVLGNTIFRSNNYGWLNNICRLLPNGDITIGAGPLKDTVVKEDIEINKVYDSLTIELPQKMELRSIIGFGGDGNHPVYGEFDWMEFY